MTAIDEAPTPDRRTDAAVGPAADPSARFRYRREYRGPVQGVILDWAGTTQDFGVFAPAVVFADVFERRGVPITMDEARAPMGLYKLDHIRAITAMPAVAARWREATGRDVTEDDVQAMFQDFRPLQVDAMARYAELIPGTVEVVAELRRRGYRIGTTTGYTRDAAEIVLREAARQGYAPDATVTADEVPAGRPEPWMLLRNLEQLRVYPPAAAVKVGDTLVDIDEGLNAGCWTIGVAASGNYVAHSREELEALDTDRRRELVLAADDLLRRRGAHYVVETIADILPCLDDIEARLAAGECP